MNKFGTAVVLAGGKSSRMGFDKQLLKLNQVRLIELLTNKLAKKFDEIIIVSNKPEYYLNFPQRIVSDEIPDQGPLSGVHIGLKAANSKYVYFIACDMPYVSLDYISFMKEKIAAITIDACVAKIGDQIEPFNGFYSKEIIDDIENYLLAGNKAIHLLLEQLNSYYINENQLEKFGPARDLFVNLNTKDDLAKYYKSISLIDKKGDLK